MLDHDPVTGRGLRAVICDDDPVARQIADMVLTEAGHEVIGECAMATEAIGLAAAAKADVIVLDLSLMGMTGLEAVPILREEAPGCEIVVFSAFDTLREGASDLGVEEVVDKTDSTALAAAVARVAARRGRPG